ncbi:hypothetical protein PPERSA_10702 [Pseudocohnilembus persalinus]|uniref:Uncharacterized protein n=1 Tax=Pseudocohnilembus persalinus TaxID=266149 RepID=A0A0V0QDD2_PSEPJ|nr:hypothetical protein PPERSA_10702 [Pseudocohnilembus persalinus]|eukprot:KRX00203.1 hypothetical protein PPERSA_10702 [Pseudocohnilembus persalinus]
MAKYFQQNYIQNNNYDIKYKDVNFKNLVEAGKPYKSPNDNYITQYIDDYSIAHTQQNKQQYVPVNKIKRENHIKNPQSFYENNLLLMGDNNLDDQYKNMVENKYLQKQQNQNQIGRPDLPLFGEPYPRNIKQHLSPFFGCGNCFSVDSDEETQDTDNDIKENEKNEQKMQEKIKQQPSESVKKQNESKNYKKIEITVPKKAKGMDEELRLLSDIFNRNDKHCEWCHFDSQQEKKWEKIFKDFMNDGGVSRAPEKFQQRKLIQKKREQQALEQFLEEYKKGLKPKKNRPWQEDINLDLCHKREKSLEQQEDLNIDKEQNKNIEEYLNDNITKKQMIEKLIEQIQLKKQKKVQNNQDDIDQINLFEILSELGLLKTISVDNFLQTLQNMMDKQNYQKDKIILPQFSLDQILNALQNQNNENENIQQTIKKSGKYANKDILNTLSQKEIGKLDDSKYQELVKNDLMKYLKKNQIQHEQCLIEGQRNKEQYDTYFKPSQQQVLNGNIFGKPYIKEFEKYMYDKKYEYILQTKKLSISEQHAKDYNDMVKNMMEKLGLTNKIDILQYLTPNKQGEIHPQIQAILDKYDYHCWVHLKNVLAQELKDKIEDLFKENLKKINMDHNFNLKFKERPLEDYIEALKHLERPKKQYSQLITPHKDPKYLNLTQNLYGKSQKNKEFDYEYQLNEIPQKYHQEFNELQQMKNKQKYPVKQEDVQKNKNSQNLDVYQKYDFTKNLVSDSDSEDYLNDKNQNKKENQKEGEIDMKYSSFLNYTDKFEKSRQLREQEEKKEKRRREKQKIKNFLEKAKNLNDYVKQQKIQQNQNVEYKQDQQFGVADFENAAYGSYYVKKGVSPYQSLQESQESFNQTHNQEQLKHERFLESMPIEQNFEDDKNNSHEYFNRTLGEQELKNEIRYLCL